MTLARPFLALLLLALPTLAAAPQAVTDDLGQEIRLPAAPQRIVSLAPSNTELLFAIGLGDRVVGVTEYCNFPPAAQTIESVAGFSDLNAEKIAAVQPDLVIASRGNDAEALETVRRLGVPVFGLANNTVAQTIESLRRLGRLTGQQEVAGRVAEQLQARVDSVIARVQRASAPPPSVLWGFAGDPIYTAGDGTIIDDVIVTAGGRNLGREAGSGWPQVSLETVVGWEPAVLLTSLRVGDDGVGDGDAGAAVAAEVARLRQVDGWRTLPAIRDGRLVHVEGDLLTRAGPRIVDAVEILADALIPPR